MRPPRTRRTRRLWFPGVLGALAAALVLALAPVPGVAAPDVPDDAGAALEQLRALNEEAERLTEQWHRAQDRLEAARAKLEQAKAEAAAARKARQRALERKQQFRAQVDRFTRSSFRGMRLSRVTAVLASSSAGEYVDRMAALEMLAADNREAIERLSAALARARRAEQRAEAAMARAAEAKRKAARIEAQRQRAREDMLAQIEKVQQRLDQLTAGQRQAYTSGGVTDFVLDAVPGGGGSDLARQAVQVALAQQGDPYVWAAEGPDAFDCSGLVVYSYGQVGIDLPRSSSQQAQAGRPVSRGELQPGDLIALYSPVHHIGIYVGDGKYVHAPYSGTVVRVEPVPWDLVTAMRRVA